MYEGRRHTDGSAVVTINGRPLSPRFDLGRYSSTGFDWGYLGSGSSQLALAILVHHLDDEERAKRLYPGFKLVVIAWLPWNKPWSLAPDEVELAVNALETTPWARVAM